MTNIEDQLWKLDRTMYKMAFMLAVIPQKSDLVEPDLIVVPSSSRGIQISAPLSKYAARAGLPGRSVDY